MSEQQWTKFANQSKFKVDLSDKFWNYVSLFLAEMVIRSDTWLVYFPAITMFPPLLKWLFLQFRTFKQTFGSTKCEDCTKPKKTEKYVQLIMASQIKSEITTARLSELSARAQSK